MWDVICASFLSNNIISVLLGAGSLSLSIARVQGQPQRWPFSIPSSSFFLLSFFSFSWQRWLTGSPRNRPSHTGSHRFHYLSDPNKDSNRSYDLVLVGPVQLAGLSWVLKHWLQALCISTCFSLRVSVRRRINTAIICCKVLWNQGNCKSFYLLLHVNMI